MEPFLEIFGNITVGFLSLLTSVAGLPETATK